MKIIPSLAVISLLAAPLGAMGQVTTVFQDSFTGGSLSTLNPTAASPGTLTSSQTAYEIAASKNISSGTTIASGVMTIGGFSTASAYGEAQALFTSTPVTLTTPGQYIEVYYVFTDTTTLFNGNAGANEQINIGLYNSGGSGPTNGTLLWTGNLGTGSTTADVGATKGWVGYDGMIAYSTNNGSVYSSELYTRLAQTAANNSNQGLGGNSSATLGGFLTGPGALSEPTLTNNSQYTLDLKIYYISSTSLLITNTLYLGNGTSGQVFSAGATRWQYGTTASGSNFATNSFDGLCIGFRPTSTPTTAESMKINDVTVLLVTPIAPNITGLTNQTVVAGNNATLSPTVTGVPTPTYQWQLTNSATGNFTNIPGATSASLTLSNVQYAQNGYVYSLIASNSLGNVTNSMTLSVILPPSISGLNPQSATVGNTVTISPAVSGVPAPTLQWQTNGVNLADGPDANGSTISGSQTSTLNIANAQVADTGTYSLIASNSAGIVTNSMYLTVAAGNVLPAITGPTNITVIQGNNGTFSASVSGLPVPTLQWLDQTGTPIPGATGSSLTLSNVLYSQNGYFYSLVASNSVGSVTNSAMLTVIVPPAITGQPVSLVVTNSQSASFTVAATGVPDPAYQWYANGSPVSSTLNNTATNATLTLASVAPSNSASSYYVQVSNLAGATNSATVTLTVNSTMAVAALSPANGATGVCYDAPLYLTFSQTPTLQKAGTIKIFNVTNSATPVDAINLSLNVDNPSSSSTNIAFNVQGRTIAGETFTNFPVIIMGNTAAIYPHLDLLTSNQTYYVTVDDGTFTDPAGANFAGITATNKWQFTTKVGGPAYPTNLVVAADGSGDFVTVQGAVDSVPSANTTPTVINIHNGIYTEIVDVHSKHNLLFRGQSRSGTIVGYPNNANLQGSTHYRMAFKVNGNDIALDNLTVTNMTPVGGSQAEALMLETGVARFILNNANVGSYQDTLLANTDTSVGYFNNSLIEGQFDYIWGGGNLFFTNCELRTLLGYNGTTSGGNLTASRTGNGATGNWPGYYGLLASNGFSFVNCQLTRGTSTVTNTTLADSNGTTNGNVAWINCSMDSNYITPSTGVLNSQLLWEYGNSNLTDMAAVTFGLGVGDSAPELSSGDPRLLAAQCATTWLNGWVPQLSPNILTHPASQSISGGATATFTVAATGIPNPAYQWLFNGNPMAGQTGSSLTIPGANANNAGSYSVIVSNSAGVLTSSNATLSVGNTAPTLAQISDQSINVGVNLMVTNVATDPDVPAQALTFTLPVAPTGAALSGSGVFTWRPAVSFAGSTNPVQVVVADNGTPSLSATNSFNVIVNPFAPPAISAPVYAGGLFSVTITGQVGPDYELQATTNLASGIWVDVAVTNSPASPFTLNDPNAAAQPVQFYRIVTGPPLP